MFDLSPLYRGAHQEVEEEEEARFILYIYICLIIISIEGVCIDKFSARLNSPSSSLWHSKGLCCGSLEKARRLKSSQVSIAATEFH